jgi:hypothetical protein
MRADVCARRVLRGKSRRGVKPLDLAAESEIEIVRLYPEKRKLNARRACV